MNHENYKIVIELEQKRRQAFLEIGFLLNEENEEELKETLADPLILFSRNQVYEIKLVQKHFIEKLGCTIDDLLKVKFNKLVQMISVTNKENVDEWLAKGLTLGPEDFRIEIREAKGLVTPEKCSHTHEESYNICRDCGTKKKIHG